MRFTTSKIRSYKDELERIRIYNNILARLSPLSSPLDPLRRCRTYQPY